METIEPSITAQEREVFPQEVGLTGVQREKKCLTPCAPNVEVWPRFLLNQTVEKKFSVANVLVK